ncbi:MAG: helix-turn-helix transcriptional regulator [Candidatus Kapabacteria bacterium]|nr:helix-turn-helix transcriptional regulator [Candidatus Kapabacteria bacterium]
MYNRKRLIQFFELVCDKQDELADLLNVSQSTISRYRDGKISPSTEILEKLSDLGLSLDWLFTGKGLMFADNEKGQRLYDKYIGTNYEFLKPFDRIILWINENYVSLEQFCLQTNVRYQTMHDFLYNEAFDKRILKYLNDAGCNLQWVISGGGSKYADNRMGKILQSLDNDKQNIEIDGLVNLKSGNGGNTNEYFQFIFQKKSKG